ncbi:MAG: GMC family oxidoreductase [Pseudomonadota bacterium]|nr:GMC family oxidoreductase [Pseudomonadota bacterium]
MTLEFDLVIVGAGSAGSVAAGMLAKNTNLSILVLEAGGSDLRPDIKTPIGYGATFFNPKVNWCYWTIEQKHMENRKIYVPRGKVVGGSASINAMVYLRGQKTDFDDWANFSSTDLGWEEVKKTYDLLEGVGGDNETALISVSDVSDQHQAMIQKFFEAGEDIGFYKKQNINSGNSEGIGHYPITTKFGVRRTSADSFLKPSIKRKNLTLLRNCHVTKLAMNNNKVTRVDFLQGGRSERSVSLRVGAILAAGAINTPQLLMLSGVGPANELKDHGIDVVIDNRNVGRNLQDHIGIDYFYETTEKSLNRVLGTWSGRIVAAFKYLTLRKGPFSLSVNQAGGFVDWNSRRTESNLQLYFNPATYSIRRNTKKRELLRPDKFDGFAIGFQPCRPNSRGFVKLQSNDPLIPPIINPRFLESKSDLHDVASGIQCIEALVSNKNLKDITVAAKSIDLENSTINDKLADFRSRAVSVYHPCGTCRVGRDPLESVVSEDFKFRELDNLWVADASLFPNITSGNINAPTMMLAYKVSQSICKQLKNKKR